MAAKAAAVPESGTIVPPLSRTRRTMNFTYGFIFTFMAFTAFLILNPTSKASSFPWFTDIDLPAARSSPYRSEYFSSIFFYLGPSRKSLQRRHDVVDSSRPAMRPYGSGPLDGLPAFLKADVESSSREKPNPRPSADFDAGPAVIALVAANTSVPRERPSGKKTKEEIVDSLTGCDLYDGNWVRDESYPLYRPGSCSLIDEQFNCFANGRPDDGYSKLRWKPRGCTLPRLDGKHMLKLLAGKRVAFVGDSLNRNMWESLVCILRNSARDAGQVFEARGKHFFRTDASYSFIFKDYNCSVEFFVSPFLVREWEVSKKETLRLDLMGKSSEEYRNADILVFNTGHWWTHEKTSRGSDYYQEGSHVYGELNVAEAFRRALTTWGRWVDANVDPARTLVLFRGYSPTHFSGGKWSSGGQCDRETEPIREEEHLAEYPEKMRKLESVMRGMKTPVAYLNVTRMTDFRKDGHPSVYRRKTDKPPPRDSIIHDCSHWCLPGVPDSWNHLLYAELLLRLKKEHRPTPPPSSPA